MDFVQQRHPVRDGQMWVGSGPLPTIGSSDVVATDTDSDHNLTARAPGICVEDTTAALRYGINPPASKGVSRRKTRHHQRLLLNRRGNTSRSPT